MIRTVYHFDDLGRKVPVGSYDDGLLPVGGRIFYIDSNSDETVEFYDSNGNVISNVAVGNTPAYYKVTSAGVSSKDKYYVYNTTEFVTPKTWGYYDIYIGGTGTSIGTGKTNTSKVLLIEDTSTYYDSSIWKSLETNNMNKLNGCDDWYIGSNDELTQLKNSNLVDWFSENYMWSSTEASNTICYRWYYSEEGWINDTKKKTAGCCFIRSF